jgi:PadR family transcriptional regulator PadR
MNAPDKLISIKKGLLEFVVLTVIAKDRVYAADILKTLAPTEFATQEGTLYPLLSRFRREGAVEYEWVESEAGPPRKYYKLTPKGKEQLAALQDYWDALNLTIKKFQS